MTSTAVVPTSWFGSDFNVTSGDRTLARLDLSCWRERGVITIGDFAHRVYRESLLGDFVIERGGQVLARAAKPSAFRNTMQVTHGGRQYTLRKKSIWRRGFVLLDGDRQIGSIAPEHLWTRRSLADLPDDWPMPVKVFVIWLVIILWKRENNSGASSGA